MPQVMKVIAISPRKTWMKRRYFVTKSNMAYDFIPYVLLHRPGRARFRHQPLRPRRAGRPADGGLRDDLCRGKRARHGAAAPRAARLARGGAALHQPRRLRRLLRWAAQRLPRPGGGPRRRDARKRGHRAAHTRSAFGGCFRRLFRPEPRGFRPPGRALSPAGAYLAGAAALPRLGFCRIQAEGNRNSPGAPDGVRVPDTRPEQALLSHAAPARPAPRRSREVRPRTLL